MSKRVLIPIAQGTEEMEAVIIIDMLRRAGIQVVVAGANDITTCSRGIKIVPDILLEDIEATEKFDAIIIPGGSTGVTNLSRNQYLDEILKIHTSTNGLTAAICAAPVLLAEKKLFPENINLTSHPLSKNQLQQYNYIEEKVVHDGNFITSRGAGTAFEFSLILIELLVNSETSKNVAKEIVLEY